MSDIIKSLKQKLSDGSFTNEIKFNSNGSNVNMFSTLNLEQELRVGGCAATSISTQNEVTIIKSVELTIDGEKDYTTITAIKEVTDGTVILSMVYSSKDNNIKPIVKISFINNDTINEYYSNSTTFYSILENWGVTL